MRLTEAGRGQGGEGWIDSTPRRDNLAKACQPGRPFRLLALNVCRFSGCARLRGQWIAPPGGGCRISFFKGAARGEGVGGRGVKLLKFKRGRGGRVSGIGLKVLNLYIEPAAPVA